MKNKYKLMLTIMASVLLISFVSAAISSGGIGKTTLSYTISNSVAVEMKDALCHNYNYKEKVMEYVEVEADGETTMVVVEIDNPESCQNFADRMIKEFIKNHIKAYRNDMAKKDALAIVNAMQEPSIE